MATLPVGVIVRGVHVLAMALLLGGAVVVAAALVGERGRAARGVLRAYEWTFWGAIGVSVITGVGNLGGLGAVPLAGSRWGGLLLAKLLLVVVLLLGSVLRTLLVVRLDAAADDAAPRVRRALLVAYGGTAAALVLIVGLAVVMAHG